ncbi:MAG: cell division FtsZ family protein, partial [Malacoplasma sp.]|nr:cell division FtsZ family protein [Malacoplasma sp.]
MASNRSTIDKILNSFEETPIIKKNELDKKQYELKQNEIKSKPESIIVNPNMEKDFLYRKQQNNIETAKASIVTSSKRIVPSQFETDFSNTSSGIKIKKEINSLQDINANTLVQILSNREKTFSKTFNIKVIGIGGAGNNIVKYMVQSQDWPNFVEVIAINTDYVALSALGSELKNIFILGADELNGNGSGGDPNVGQRAAEADAETIKQMLEGTDVLILAAGLGKGTGTGATPIIAKIAQDMGILTIGLFNLPSVGAEGNKTYSNALFGLQKLSHYCNGLTTVNNDKIINLDRDRMSIKKAYQGANRYIKTIVEEIINIITKPSDINVDFADVRNFFEDKNGFLFLRIDLTDYTKDAIKEALESAIKTGFSEINIHDSQKALINFKLNENVPSLILENTRSALKEIVGSGNINIVHGIAYNDVFENAEINILLTGSFELGAIEEVEDEPIINEPVDDVEETDEDTVSVGNPFDSMDDGEYDSDIDYSSLMSSNSNTRQQNFKDFYGSANQRGYGSDGYYDQRKDRIDNRNYNSDDDYNR